MILDFLKKWMKILEGKYGLQMELCRDAIWAGVRVCTLTARSCPIRTSMAGWFWRSHEVAELFHVVFYNNLY